MCAHIHHGRLKASKQMPDRTNCMILINKWGVDDQKVACRGSKLICGYSIFIIAAVLSYGINGETGIEFSSFSCAALLPVY